MLAVGFDNRSLNSSRVTGWERFAKELWGAFSNEQNLNLALKPLFPPKSNSLLDRYHDFAREPGRLQVVHYPTFPPGWLTQGPRTLVTIHDLTWWFYPEYASKLGKDYFRIQAEFALRRGAHVATVSETSRRALIEFFNLEEDRVRTIYPGLTGLSVPRNTATGLAKLNDSKPYILFVGTVEPRKNIEGLVEAFKISGLSRDFDLILVGRKAWGQLPQGIKVIQSQTDSDLALWYQNASAFVMPSLYEGFGLPILEAMSFGVPCAVSDIPVFKEVARDYAHYFDPRSLESIASALNSVVIEPSIEKVTTAKDYANSFSWSKTANGYGNYYAEIARISSS